MVKFVEMDEKGTFSNQMKEDTCPVILITNFNMNPEDVDQFLKVWPSTVEVAKRQGGFISAQLHRGIAGNCVFVAYVVFESAKHFNRVFNNPEFQSKLADYPSSIVITPHMFKKVAVPGICVD